MDKPQELNKQGGSAEIDNCPDSNSNLEPVQPSTEEGKVSADVSAEVSSLDGKEIDHSNSKISSSPKHEENVAESSEKDEVAVEKTTEPEVESEEVEHETLQKKTTAKPKGTNEISEEGRIDLGGGSEEEDGDENQNRNKDSSEEDGNSEKSEENSEGNEMRDDDDDDENDEAEEKKPSSDHEDRADGSSESEDHDDDENFVSFSCSGTAKASVCLLCGRRRRTCTVMLLVAMKMAATMRGGKRLGILTNQRASRLRQAGEALPLPAPAPPRTRSRRICVESR